MAPDPLAKECITFNFPSLPWFEGSVKKEIKSVVKESMVHGKYPFIYQPSYSRQGWPVYQMKYS
jgi:hypothetical protein